MPATAAPRAWAWLRRPPLDDEGSGSSPILMRRRCGPGAPLVRTSGWTHEYVDCRTGRPWSCESLSDAFRQYRRNRESWPEKQDEARCVPSRPPGSRWRHEGDTNNSNA